ncbi:MAG TPA: DeoR family transcriptional regulator [Candidatus Paceibacterota bacterium]|jgi:hypothetical protein|nr:DeoR family transcriptional regulator [Candidatus Paceibacterota bacterium]
MRQNGNGNRQDNRQSGKTDPAIIKAYEICYALFRIGAKLQNAAFAESLERQALRLLNEAIDANGAKMQDAATAIGYLVGFGEGIGFIHPGNAETIKTELGALSELTVLPVRTGSSEEVSLEDIFSKKQEPLFGGGGAGKSASVPANGKSQSGNAAKNNNAASGNSAIRQPAMRQNEPPADLPELKFDNGNGESGNDNPAMRQTAILEKIRQSGNCRLKEIVELLPDASERTIRYDLQSLVEQNLVERVGSGGPMVFYRPR